jgi:SpoVK/Ycf46/Vps4 family AAA+-type ATPase
MSSMIGSASALGARSPALSAYGILSPRRKAFSGRALDTPFPAHVPAILGSSMAPLRDLELMIQSRYPLIAIETFEEARLERILAEVVTSLRVPFFVWSVTTGLKRYGSLTSIYDSQTPLKALNNVAAMPGEGLFLFKDLHRYFEKPEVVRKLQDLAPSFKMDRRVIVLSAARLVLPAELQTLAGVFTLDLPGPDELKAIAQRVVADLSRQRPIRVDLTPADFDRLVERMRGFTELEAERAITKTVLRDGALSRNGLEAMVEIKKELLQKEGILEYIAPEENLAEVGGFRNLKTWLAKRKRAFAPEAKGFGLAAPRGILLLGVQGAGKTLVARAIAREWELPLLKMETGRLYDKFIGESEKNLDKALRTAEQMAPCVLMIDELEKALSYSPSGDSDAGLSKRIFGRLLGWLQDRTAPVFVVTTSNNIAELPPELTRKGRFDEIFFVDLPSAEDRKEILAVHLRKRKRDPAAFDLDRLAADSEGFTGAEIQQAIISGLYTAFSRSVELNTDIVLDELRSTKPLSVTRREEIDALRAWARERAVIAN